MEREREREREGGRGRIDSTVQMKERLLDSELDSNDELKLGWVGGIESVI